MLVVGLIVGAIAKLLMPGKDPGGIFVTMLLGCSRSSSSGIPRTRFGVVRPAPLLLIKDGRLQRHQMKQEMITEEELMGQLREQGLEAVEQVKKCYLEGDGHVSVIKMDSK